MNFLQRYFPELHPRRAAEFLRYTVLFVVSATGLVLTYLFTHVVWLLAIFLVATVISGFFVGTFLLAFTILLTAPPEARFRERTSSDAQWLRDPALLLKGRRRMAAMAAVLIAEIATLVWFNNLNIALTVVFFGGCVLYVLLKLKML
jgi:hypothetical protein